MSFLFLRIRVRLFAAAFVASIAALIAPHPAQAQEAFPNKPITIVVGFAPGGGTDIIIRLFARAMEAHLGQRIVVENRAGAGATIAAAHVARAPADGYTLLAGSVSVNAVAPNLYKGLTYDSQTAFAPVSLLVTAPAVLVVSPKLNISSMKDLIAMYQREPGKHNFATGGGGTHAHLMSEWLMMTIGAKAVHVPFKGAAPALQAVLGGEPTMIVDNIQAVLPHIAAGKLKPLAVFSAQRASTLPDVPTMVELGYKDFITDSWTAIYAPAGTPPAVIAKLNAAAAAAAHDPQTIEMLTKINAAPVGSPPAVLDQLTNFEYKRWGALIKQLNLSAN